MRSRVLLLITVFALTLMCFSTISQGAPEDWNIKTNLQSTYGYYYDSKEKDSLKSAGVFVAIDHLNKEGFTIGANFIKLNLKNTDDIYQSSLFGSVRYSIFPASIPGKITLRLDGHIIVNDDSTGLTDNVKVISPQVSFLNFDKTLYLDLAYAHSFYDFDLNVNQFTIAAGLGLNDAMDWIQVRTFIINTSNASRSQGKDSLFSVEIKGTHWFNGPMPLRIDNVQLTALLGERIYAVDSDSAMVYNLVDLQKNAFSAGAHWTFGERFALLLIAGTEDYTNELINDSYSNIYLYADLSAKW